jgi:hypothetical protein
MKTNYKTSVQINGKTYKADGKYLVCEDIKTGKQCFRKTFGHPQYMTLNNLDIREVHTSPDGEDIVLLFEPAPPGYKTVGNLARVTSAGEVVWWAELTDTGGDTYVAVETGEGKIVANSWDCYRCEIDLQTGRILSKTFTK